MRAGESWSRGGTAEGRVSLGRSGSEEETCRLFEAFFDADEEGDGFLAIDEPVVVAHGEVHHGADFDLAIDGDGTLLDGVHAEDSALWRIEDGRAEETAVDAAVGDGEDTALEVFDGDFAVAGLDGVVGEVFFGLAEGFLIAVAEDWDDEAFFGADGDADVEVIIEDDVIAIDAAVDLGDGFEGFGDGLDEEGHEAEFDPVTGDEAVLEELAEIHDLRHVDLVKGGEDGGGVLRVDEMGGDFAAEGRHPLAGGAAGVVEDDGGGGGDWFGDDGEVDFGGSGGGGWRWGGGSGWGRGGFRGGGRGRSRGGSWGWGGGWGAFGDGADDGADFDFFAGWGGDLESAGGFGLEFGGDLIGVDGDEEVADLDGVAVIFVPCGDDGAGDGFAGVGDFDFEGHGGKRWGRAWSPVRLPWS